MTKNYFRNLCLHISSIFLFIDNFISGSYIQHSILALLKEKSALIYNERQEHITNNYVRIDEKLQNFILNSLQSNYIRHPMSDPL